MTPARRRAARSLGALALGILLAGGAAQVAAPAARAACDGGTTYDAAAASARAAVVGRVEEIAQGGLYVTAVRVERRAGVATDGVYRHWVQVGDCGSDQGEVGARVVILLGVENPVPGGPTFDLFFTVGRTVTPWQAASVFANLPDTAAAAPRLPGGPLPPWGVPALAGVLALGLVLARPPRRAHRTSR